MLQKLADNSKTAYDLIAATGKASANQQRDAQIRSLEDQKAAFIAAGKDLPAEQQATLDHLLNQQSYYNQRHEDQWHTLYLNIDGIVSGLSRDLVKDLFESPSSFGKTAIKALQSIGEAVVTSFIKPATDAIAHFIATSIADLLSGKGLGGILSDLKEIGTTFNTVFSSTSKGKGSIATPSFSGAPIPGLGGVFSGGGTADWSSGIPDINNTVNMAATTVPGGISSTATGAFSSAVSTAFGAAIAPIVGIFTGAISAISSVVGNFQMAHMSSDLTKIENSVRRTDITVEGSVVSALQSIDGNIHDARLYQEEYIFPMLKNIRDGVLNFVGIKINLSPDAGQTQELLANINQRVLTQDTSTADRLLDVVSKLRVLNDSVTGGFGKLIAALNTQGGLIVGAVHASKQSLLQSILGGGIGGLGNAAGGIASAATGGLLSLVKGLLPSHDETLYARIEANTRYSALYLGDRADGGILGVSFRILDALLFGTATKALEKISDYGVADLDLIQDHTGWLLAKVNEIDKRMASGFGGSGATSTVQNVSNGGNIFNFAFNGIQNPSDMAQAIVSELKMLGVHI